jgi:hypothetical protein
MPKGWYGDEEYDPNANAFLEYLDDVHKRVSAKGDTTRKNPIKNSP